MEQRFVKEVNAGCYLLEHEKTGARVLKVAAPDVNKTFSIAFFTLPWNNSGIPHILEHCVLNGSKNFPVKSPFDVLLKGSLNTYLNAMTYDDFTIYPVASINERDYFNLMHVYCDAVFNPLIYDEPRIFMQEGWHYELDSRDAPLVYKGVVYNEMKGAFSTPVRELWYQVQKNLFPENGYRFSSGGYPDEIPALSYKQFLDFHKQHYHPSNSFIYLYGDARLEEELAFLDREYLSHFERSSRVNHIPRNMPFSQPREVNAQYPLLEGTSTENQTFLTLNWVIGDGADQATVMALDILADVLINRESAPVRKAIMEAGIGKNTYATAQNLRQNIFSIVVQNANPGEMEKFREVVMNSLRKICLDKIDREALQGSLNRMEFRLREGDDAQKGLASNLRCMSGWLYTGDPFPSLEYEKQLAGLRQTLESSSLENLIQSEMIDNPYCLAVTLEPKPGLEKQNASKISEFLASEKKKLTPADIDTILEATRSLKAYQQKEDSPEALASIPLLKLSDISSKASWYQAEKLKTNGITQLYHNEFCNDIVYMNFWFDARVLPRELIPYASLLKELLGKMPAGSFSYEQLDKALNIHTGGFSSNLTVFLPGHDDNQMMPRFRVHMKTTSEKLDASIDLLKAILNETLLEDKQRLIELVRRHQAQLESSMIQNGYGVALNRLESYFSRRGVFNDVTRGMNYYWFVTELAKDFGKDPDRVTERLRKTQALLFNRKNLVAGTTCSREDFGRYSRKLPDLVSSLSGDDVRQISWDLEPLPLNEGIITPSKVQYVLQGYNFRKLGWSWDGKWNVLSQILSTDWLQTRIRVMGGAYGGFSSISRNGTICLASYRDPNLKETLDNFSDTPRYLSGFNAGSTSMTRFIIGTIAGLDYPLTPSEKGEMAFRCHMEGTTYEELQAERDAVLATTSGDIRWMSELISKILNQRIYCVYGNEDKLKENKGLFRELVVLQH